MEKLYKVAEDEGIYIYEKNFRGVTKGLYSDNVIALKRSLPLIDKRCKLGEELGHYFTTAGNIIDQTKIENIKQERKARMKGYSFTMSLDAIVEALVFPCVSEDELLDYLKVTAEHFIECISYYKEKYGLYYRCKDYTLYFEPLSVTGSCANYENQTTYKE